MTEKEIRKLKDKIILNSEYPLTINNEFCFSDPKISEKITKSGKKILKQLLKKIKDEKS